MSRHSVVVFATYRAAELVHEKPRLLLVGRPRDECVERDIFGVDSLLVKKV